MALSKEEKQEIRDIVKLSVIEVLDERLGDSHSDEHVFLREFIDFWKRSRNGVWDLILKSIITFVIAAFAAGFILMVKR